MAVSAVPHFKTLALRLGAERMTAGLARLAFVGSPSAEVTWDIADETGRRVASEAGLNANLVAGTNSGYVSGWLLTNSTEATTATLDVKLLGLSQRVPDNAFGAYAKWNVLLNNHVYRAGADGK